MDKPVIWFDRVDQQYTLENIYIELIHNLF